jgi:UBX domain-containing protein 1
MAREMGVRFLGRVAVDVQFGALVERGKVEGEDGSDDEDEEGDGSGEGKMEVEVDERPLVERYRECWSYGRFEEFAKTMVAEIDR